ncbi:tannase and feruloyl esterase [Mycena galericulata]|nr:tannase and feruloyl esterase [Mycena galericulata]
MAFEFNLNYLAQLITSGLPLLSSWSHGENQAKCLALKTSLNLENTTILDVAYVSRSKSLKPHAGEGCETKAQASVPLCRVQFSTETSPTSAVYAEAWLPDEWYGRFLALGNGGLGGCIFYPELDYGSAMHFATVGSNNGHFGVGGSSFLGNPEVVNDFAFRAIHTEAVVGKQIVEAYYGRAHDKAYYLGCSTGGRQGTQSALKYPADFDGIVAGAPATDFNHLLHWFGMMARAVGAPTPESSPAFIAPELWALVSAEVLAQCDALDGVQDGIITEPDACQFRPEALVCEGGSTDKCLTPPQVEALRKIYAPLYGDGGELLYPRFDPGAEAGKAAPQIFSGAFPNYPRDWLRYAVLNVSEFDFSVYGPAEGRLFDAVNPGGIATFDGDMSAFRDRGGKFLTYHGRIDPLIPSGNSKRIYDLTARTLAMPTLDAFYRLFLVPGMDHCAGGPPSAASQFGQLAPKRIGGAPTSTLQGSTSTQNDTRHNILLALVDWVEGGDERAPESIVGTAADGGERVHCRYPMRSLGNLL